jgi:hypothetical protein
MAGKSKKKKFKNPSNQKNIFFFTIYPSLSIQFPLVELYNFPRYDHLRTPSCIITVQQIPQLTLQQPDFNNFKNVAPEWW